MGSGGLGAHAVQLLRLSGAAPIIAVDPLPAARDRAPDFGADPALDSADPELGGKVRRETGGAGLAAAFDFAGVAAVREQAIGCLGAAGRLILVGLTGKPLTISDGTSFSYFQQQVRGHYGSAPGHVTELVKLTARGGSASPTPSAASCRSAKLRRPSSACSARRATPSGWCCGREH